MAVALAGAARFGLCEPLIVLAGVALLAMMGVTVADVVARNVFSTPLQGVVEMVEFAMVWCTFAGIAAAFFLGGHITVDLVDAVAGEGVRRAVTLLAAALATAGMAALTFLAYRELLDALDWGDTTVDLGIPLWLYWVAITGGFLLGALLCLARLIIGDTRDEAGE